MLQPSAQSDTATHAYLRQVRKLRSRHRADPAKLSAALTELNRSREARIPQSKPTEARPVALKVRPVRAVSPAVEPPPLFPGLSPLFAAEVEQALRNDAGSLRYTTRSRLLARAERLGVSRFDANLIIASVLHHHRPARTAPAPAAVTPLLWLSALALVSLAATAVWG